jgi:hypothetical protein
MVKTAEEKKAYFKARYEAKKNTEEYKKQQRDYYEKNKEKIKENAKKNHEKNKNNEEYIKKKRGYYKKYEEKNKEKRKEYAKKYREENKEKIKEAQLNYKKNNPDRLLKTKRISMWKKYGIICENYDEMYEKYINTTCCDYCNKSFVSSQDRQLDHDHNITDAPNVRGVLCINCNTRDVYGKNEVNLNI